MMKIYDLQELSLKEVLDRSQEEQKDVSGIVAEIIAAVRRDGDRALKEYAKRFDGADLTDLVVSESEIDEAMAKIDDYFIETLRQAEANIRLYHEKQLRSGYEIRKEASFWDRR